VIFVPGYKVTEIKILEPGDLPFMVAAQAEAHRLQLCETWIDEQAT